MNLVGTVIKISPGISLELWQGRLWTCNFSPYIDVPPRPVPVGSPPCTIKSCPLTVSMRHTYDEASTNRDDPVEDDAVVVSSSR